LPAFFDEEGPRTMALRDMDEESARALLAIAPDGEALVQDILPASRWLASRFPLIAFSPRQSSEFSPAESPAVPEGHNVQVVLLLGWKGLQVEQSVAMVERAQSFLSCVEDAVGATLLNILLAERVHELEDAEERRTLREMELLKAELLATVSHELRSPLASIKGYASTLLRHGRRISAEERQEFLLAIAEASKRLEISIDRLLEMSEIETGAIHIKLSPTDVGHLASEAMTAARQRVAERQLNTFSFKLRLGEARGTFYPAEHVIMADQRRLREVLDHLLENALNFSPQGGKIDVIVRFMPLHAFYGDEAAGSDASRELANSGTSEHILEICVCDNGTGIPPKDLQRIFERFQRVDNSLTREVNGLGLGLAICKRIVELHGGSIWAESCPAGGSAFHVLLPVGEAEEIPTPVAGVKLN
jgi:signal transduction histidine kinase